MNASNVVRSILFGVVLTLVSCEQVFVKPSEIRRELLVEHGKGLWLAEWRGRGFHKEYITLYPFALGGKRSLAWPPDYQEYRAGWFVADGRAVLASRPDGAINLINEKGEVLASRSGAPDIRYAAVSADRQRIAFTRGRMQFQEEPPHIWHYEYFWGYMNSTVNYLVNVSEGRESSDVLSFSPDGRYLAIGIDGEVRIYDLEKSGYSVVGAGRDPTWSSSGEYLAFRTLEQDAMLYHFHSRRSTEFLSGRKLLGRLDWSPDSKYVLVSELYKSLMYGTTRLVVARVSDEATGVVLNPIMGETNENFGWLFCRE